MLQEQDTAQFWKAVVRIVWLDYRLDTLTSQVLLTLMQAGVVKPAEAWLHV